MGSEMCIRDRFVVETEAEEAELLQSMEEEIVLRMVRQLATITEIKDKKESKK